MIPRKDSLRPLLIADPPVPERLSETLAPRPAERDDALHRTVTAEYEGPASIGPDSCLA